MEKQKGDKSTRKFFKERKLTKKGFLVTKGVVKRKYRNPRRLSHTHNPPNNSPHQELNQKGGCMRLFKEQQRMYMARQTEYCLCIYTTLQSLTHVYREYGCKNQAKGQTTVGDCQWMKILQNATQKWGETEIKSSKS